MMKDEGRKEWKVEPEMEEARNVGGMEWNGINGTWMVYGTGRLADIETMPSAGALQALQLHGSPAARLGHGGALSRSRGR